MKVRVSSIVAAASLIALTACGGTTGGSPEASAPSASAIVSTPPVSTSTVFAPGATTPVAVTETETVTVEAPPSITSEPSCPGPKKRGTGASAFEGTFQRHESQLILQRDTDTSTLIMGASAVDSENWRVDWAQDECDSGEVIVTLLERTALSGTGVDGELYEGKTFRLRFGTSSIGTSVIVTTGLGDDPGVYTWCGVDSGAVPECGA